MTDDSTPATRLAAAYALLRMAADLGDHRIDVAEAVFALLGVSTSEGSDRQWSGWIPLRCRRWQVPMLRFGMHPLRVTA